MQLVASPNDLYSLVAWLVGLGVLDILLRAVKFPHNDASGTGRYYVLHICCNFFVVAVHLDDVLAAYKDPIFSYQLPCDNRGTVAILACHLHHILWYRPLPMVDWVHHILMIIVMLPLAYGLQPGALLGHGAFYASGLPGGLDYIMLVAVKQGWMESITEKRLNTSVQLWIRAPGCLCHAILTWVSWSAAQHSGVPYNKDIILPEWMFVPATLTMVLLFFWNGLYFLVRVVDNYAERRTELRFQKAAAKDNGIPATHKD
eukprot:GGOE01002318.1.p1 GENE.GGOE01002318.1~~GGOE01002318.1.p1  ORF type:complete len:259 (-),score=80.03 GGOE01002318.1:404-1180(-)